MASFKRWLVFVGFAFLASTEHTSGQEQYLADFFKPVPHLWQNDSLQTALRPRLYLHGRWRASSQKPPFHGEVELPGSFSFEGEVQFQRAFRLDSTFMNRSLRLVVQGAHYAIQVKINGDLIGSHQGGYTPFVADLQLERLFFDKENLFEISVSNVLAPLQTLPPKQRPWGWLNEGGIGREIYLEALPKIFVEKTKLNYQIEPQLASINLEAELRSQKKMTPEESASITAVVEIWDVNRRQKITAGFPLPLATTDKLQQSLALNCQITQPALWSPATPNLYTLRLVLFRQNNIIDETWEQIGFRKIEIVAQQLHLNGAPWVLRGVNWIEDYGNRSAQLDTAKLRKLLSEVKELGANTIRVIGHSPHPLLPRLCDRAGIFLLEELPLYYLTETHIRHPQFLEVAQLQAREMMARDLARPSVLGWGIAVNSDICTPEARNIINNLCQVFRQLDSRPIYAVTTPNWFADWEPLVDFVLPDMFENKSANDFDTMINQSQKPVLPIIGFWAREENEAGGPTLAEQRQAEKLNEVLRKFDDLPKLAGYFIQTLIDGPANMPALVLGPQGGRVSNALIDLPTNANSQNIFEHRAGLIGQNEQRRIAFQVVQAFNRGDRRPMMLPPNPTQVFPQEYPIVGILVALILLFYLNRDRRLRANLQRLFVHPHGFYVDLTENRKVPPFLSALLGLAEGCIIAVLLSGFCYANRTSLAFDQFLNLLISASAWKACLIWLIWHPSWFIATITGSLFALGLLTALFMKILGFFLGRSLPLIQYFTFVFWTAVNVLILGIVAPFFYRLLLLKEFAMPLLFLGLVILLWLLARFFRGMRVVYTMSIPRTIIIFGILVGGLIISLALYYQRTEAIFEYGKYYWRMLEAGL